MASWIYSLARNMATNQGESNQGNPCQVQGNQGQHNQGNPEIENSGNSGPDDLVMEVLKQLVQENRVLGQENRALNAKVEAIGMQMTEMMGILQALKNGTTTEAAAVVNLGGTATILPTSGPAETATTIPPPGTGIPHFAHSPGANGQSHPTAQWYPWGMPAGYTPQNVESKPAGITGPSQAVVVIPGGAAGGPQVHAPNHDAALQRNPLSQLLQRQSYSVNELDEEEVQEELVAVSFEKGNWDTLGEPSGKYDYMVRYDAPESAQIKIEEIQPSGWGDEAEDDEKDQNEQKYDGYKTQNYQYKKRVSFDPIPMTYTELFDHLISKKLINTRSMKPVQPPFPRSYDPEATCKFHAGGVGHSVEDCKALKRVVQDLIDSKHLNFNDSNVNGLTVKEGGESSAVAGKRRSPQYNPIPVSYADLCSYLISHGWITPCKMRPVQPPFPSGYNPEATCELHAGAIGHSAENCYLLKSLVQGFIDSKQLTFEKGGRIKFSGSVDY